MVYGIPQTFGEWVLATVSGCYFVGSLALMISAPFFWRTPAQGCFNGLMGSIGSGIGFVLAAAWGFLNVMYEMYMYITGHLIGASLILALLCLVCGGYYLRRTRTVKSQSSGSEVTH